MADYHRYVFSDGKLLGQFEDMYRQSRDIPWHQDEQDTWVDVRLTEQLLADIGPFDEIYDYGCGLGYYLDILKVKIGSPDCKAFGYDVSPTACARAKALFPTAKFAVSDLTDVAFASGQVSSRGPGNVLRVIRGTLWYVFPKMTNVVSNLRSDMVGGELLLVVQNFPPLEGGFIGKDVIPNPEALVHWFSEHFSAVRTLWYEDRVKQANDNWFIGLFSAR